MSQQEESYGKTVPSVGGLERFSGFTLLKDGVPHQVHAPRGDKGRALIRVLPEISNGAEMPWRLSSDRCDFSGWIRAEKIVRMAGVNNKFTAFCRVQGKDRRYAGPIQRFIETITNSIKNSPTSIPPEWVRWKDKLGPLPSIEQAGFVQCMLFENAGFAHKDNMTGKYKPLMPVLFMMPKSARMAIETLCDAEVEGFKGETNDFNHRYKVGDPCSTAEGRLLQLVYVPQQGNMLSHYDVTAIQQPCPISAELAKTSFRPWSDILNFLTEEEQMELLVNHFPAEAVDYVFGQTALTDMLPKAVRGRWMARLQQRMPAQPQQGFVPQQGYGQMPAQQTQFDPAQMPYFGAPQVQPAAPMPAPVFAPAPAVMQNPAPAAVQTGRQGEYDFSLDEKGASDDGIPFDAGPANANINPPVTSPVAQQPFQAPQSSATDLAKQRLVAAQELLRKQKQDNQSRA